MCIENILKCTEFNMGFVQLLYTILFVGVSVLKMAWKICFEGFDCIITNTSDKI